MRHIPVQASMSAWPGHTYEQAAEEIAVDTHEPLWGDLRVKHVQVCPQNFGVFDEAVYDRCRRLLPYTQFRLHANVRVLQTSAQGLAASAYSTETKPYFEKLADVSTMLNAPAYTLHAGKRKECPDLNGLADNVCRIEDLFDCDVGVEGHYPQGKNMWLISSWAEYAWLLESGLKYALDLSHLNIVAKHERSENHALLAELLASDKCIEVHVSGNDGHSDQHKVLDSAPYWGVNLKHANPDAIFFSEGNQR